MRLRWRALLICVIGTALASPVAPQSQRSDPAALALESARKKEIVDGDLDAAIKLYKETLSKYPGVRSVSAEALVGLARSYQKAGNAEARQIMSEF